MLSKKTRKLIASAKDGSDIYGEKIITLTNNDPSSNSGDSSSDTGDSSSDSGDSSSYKLIIIY